MPSEDAIKPSMVGWAGSFAKSCQAGYFVRCLALRKLRVPTIHVLYRYIQSVEHQ